MRIIKQLSRTLILGIFVLSILVACNDKPSQEILSQDAKSTRTDKNIERVEKEYLKMSFFHVKKRFAYSYFYNDKEEKEAGMVEEVTFDENGNRIEHIKYTKGEIDYRFVYEYDHDNKLKFMKSFNIDGDQMIEKKYIYDKSGMNTGINERDFYEERNSKYYKLIYRDSLLVEKKIDNFRFNQIGHEITRYDSLGYKIVLIKSEPNIGSYSTYYRHDKFGNITEIIAPYYKLVFTYDDKGNVLTEELYDQTSRQHKFVYDYDDDGLLLEKRRYDIKEKMIFKLEYKYEFY